MEPGSDGGLDEDERFARRLQIQEERALGKEQREERCGISMDER